MFTLWKKRYDKPRQYIQKQRYHFANKGPYGESYGSSNSHIHSQVWMWELDRKEGWMTKKWCFQTVVLEKALERSLHCKEINFKGLILKEVNLKGNQSWIFIGGTVAEAEAPKLWLPDGKNWFIGKTLMLGKIEGRRRRGWQRMRWLDGITDLRDMSLSKL